MSKGLSTESPAFFPELLLNLQHLVKITLPRQLVNPPHQVLDGSLNLCLLLRQRGRLFQPLLQLSPRRLDTLDDPGHRLHLLQICALGVKKRCQSLCTPRNSILRPAERTLVVEVEPGQLSGG